ncbi:MAG: rane protein required for colicin production [Patescibacteria group bacterium]|nr:rane protein required for colicin production [Patescibacteria group bacterium]
MSILDLILVAFLAFAFFYGFKKGLIRSLGRIVGLIIGIYISSHYYLNFYLWGQDLLNINENVEKIIAFIILFIAVIQISNLIFYLIEKTFKLIAFIPGSKYINNILGGILGLAENALFLGTIFYVSARYLALSERFSDIANDSIVLPWLNKTVEIILPLLPQALKTIQTII